MNSLDQRIEQTARARQGQWPDAARAKLDKAIVTGRGAIGNSPADAWALIQQGQTERDRGRSGSAVPLYEEAIRLLRKTSDVLKLADTLRQLGDLHRERGDSDEAEPYYGEALTIYEALDNGPSLVIPANGLKTALSACRRQLTSLRVPQG